MFVLLKRLQQLRRTVALPAPTKPGSLALRHVDCGSCNGCEHELSNAAGPHYDLDRYGLSVVASPRHADVLLGVGVIGDPAELVGPAEELLPVDVRVPGCPPTPTAIAEALLGALDLVRRPLREDER